MNDRSIAATPPLGWNSWDCYVVVDLQWYEATAHSSRYNAFVPLMFGGELRDNDDRTLSLLTNDEVLAVHRDGRNPMPVLRDGSVSCPVASHGAVLLKLS